MSVFGLYIIIVHNCLRYSFKMTYEGLHAFPSGKRYNVEAGELTTGHRCMYGRRAYTTATAGVFGFLFQGA